MTFDLLLSEGFKQPVSVTIICNVTQKQGARQYVGTWKIKPDHQHFYRLIAKSANGSMYSYYSTGYNTPFVVCYSDQLPHNPVNLTSDPACAFGLANAPMDDSIQFKHLRHGTLRIYHPANATMTDFRGRWRLWEYGGY